MKTHKIWQTKDKIIELLLNLGMVVNACNILTQKVLIWRPGVKLFLAI